MSARAEAHDANEMPLARPADAAQQLGHDPRYHTSAVRVSKSAAAPVLVLAGEPGGVVAWAREGGRIGAAVEQQLALTIDSGHSRKL